MLVRSLVARETVCEVASLLEKTKASNDVEVEMMKDLNQRPKTIDMSCLVSPRTRPRDMHLRQAALDAEVQAKVAQDELKEDPRWVSLVRRQHRLLATWPRPSPASAFPATSRESRRSRSPCVDDHETSALESTRRGQGATRRCVHVRGCFEDGWGACTLSATSNQVGCGG